MTQRFPFPISHQLCFKFFTDQSEAAFSGVQYGVHRACEVSVVVHPQFLDPFECRNGRLRYTSWCARTSGMYALKTLSASYGTHPSSWIFPICPHLKIASSSAERRCPRHLWKQPAVCECLGLTSQLRHNPPSLSWFYFTVGLTAPPRQRFIQRRKEEEYAYIFIKTSIVVSSNNFEGEISSPQLFWAHLLVSLNIYNKLTNKRDVLSSCWGRVGSLIYIPYWIFYFTPFCSPFF